MRKFAALLTVLTALLVCTPDLARPGGGSFSSHSYSSPSRSYSSPSYSSKSYSTPSTSSKSYSSPSYTYKAPATTSTPLKTPYSQPYSGGYPGTSYHYYGGGPSFGNIWFWMWMFDRPQGGTVVAGTPNASGSWAAQAPTSTKVWAILFNVLIIGGVVGGAGWLLWKLSKY